MNKQEIEKVRAMSFKERRDWIRKRLALPESVTSSIRGPKSPSSANETERYSFSNPLNEHYRFEMSGYGESVVQDNQAILDKFNDMGIYDYTSYLFLDFYKGIGTLFYSYWYGSENLEENFAGFGTVVIIDRILHLTCFSGQGTRRRG